MMTDCNTFINSVRKRLIESSDPKNCITSSTFFKEKVTLYGVKTPQVRDIAKAYYASIKSESKITILSLCEKLLESGYLEEAIIACHWSEMLDNRYEPDDFLKLEGWIHQYVSNWAVCDTFCNHTIGDFVMHFPEKIKHLNTWTQSSNRWVRRASAVSLIIPGRRGHFLDEIFSIADQLLTDPDDMVQKGYGWMLKAASQFYPDEVFNFVNNHKQTMPRTALRYAIEKLPLNLRQEAMKRS